MKIRGRTVPTASTRVSMLMVETQPAGSPNIDRWFLIRNDDGITLRVGAQFAAAPQSKIVFPELSRWYKCEKKEIEFLKKNGVWDAEKTRISVSATMLAELGFTPDDKQRTMLGHVAQRNKLKSAKPTGDETMATKTAPAPAKAAKAGPPKKKYEGGVDMKPAIKEINDPKLTQKDRVKLAKKFPTIDKDGNKWALSNYLREVIFVRKTVGTYAEIIEEVRASPFAPTKFAVDDKTALGSLKHAKSAFEKEHGPINMPAASAPKKAEVPAAKPAAKKTTVVKPKKATPKPAAAPTATDDEPDGE